MNVLQRDQAFFATNCDVTAVLVGTPGASTPTSYKNSEYDDVINSGSYFNYVFSVPFGDGVNYENLDPSICSTANWPMVERITTGSARVRVSNSKSSTIYPLWFNNPATSTAKHFQRYVDNSMSDLLSGAVLSLVSEESDLNYFSSYFPSSTTLAKNPECWASGVDLSAIPVATTMGGGAWTHANRGAAITRRHVVGAWHWNNNNNFSIGNKIRFRTPSGQIIDKTIIGKHQHFFDVVVVTLDSDIPESIIPMKLVGDWILQDSSVQGTTSTHYLGGVAFYADQRFDMRYMLIGGSAVSDSTSFCLESITIGGTTLESVVQRIQYMGPQFLPNIPEVLTGKTGGWSEAVSGDSGSPVMVLIDGTPALLGTFWYSNATPFIGVKNGALANAMIAAADSSAGVSTGYTVTVAPDPTL